MHHRVENIDFKDDFILLKVDGRKYSVNLKSQSRKLIQASDDERRNYIISPSGYGIHWPAIDEDLSVDGLIKAASQKRVKSKSKKNSGKLS